MPHPIPANPIEITAGILHVSYPVPVLPPEGEGFSSRFLTEITTQRDTERPPQARLQFTRKLGE